MSGQICFMQMFVYHWNNDKYSPEYSQHNNLEPLSLSYTLSQPCLLLCTEPVAQTDKPVYGCRRNAAPLSSYQSKHETEVPIGSK